MKCNAIHEKKMYGRHMSLVQSIYSEVHVEVMYQVNDTYLDVLFEFQLSIKCLAYR